ncbi:MAG: HAMP domain-containing histidine kinase [Chloroflexi bacterium]|nr:HAMP domain-containing histidine kinase [Chloroflexota bacterium]
MSDAQTNPLQAARDLLGELRGQASGDLTKQLTELDRLLTEAQRRGEGQDAASARQQLSDLIEANAQFTSVMVHEIRVPMTSIRGYSDMLSKKVVGELNDMQMQFVETIRSNVIRMEHLVTDISDISKIKSGRMRLDPKMDMYKNVALTVEKDTAELAAAHNHTFTFETPSGLPLLNLDSTRLALSLRKMVVNALQYTPDGGQITVKAEGIDGKLKVSVIDTGIGMTEEEQTHIGELFWRADSEHVRSFKGHGLGLPIAMGFVKMMGGEFFYESKVGQGSVFGFIVPGMG